MRPVATYTLVQATRDMSIMFITATYAPFLKHVGLNNSQITIINWVFAVLMLIAQVPTGMFADKFGRALSVKIGLGILALGHFAYFFACGFWSALIIEGFVGLGLAFVCGADQAWLVSTLRARGEGRELETAFGKANSVMFTACLVSGSIGAILGSHDLRWPWLACGVTGTFSFLSAMALMREPGRELNDFKTNALSNRDLVKRSFGLLRNSRDLRWCIAIFCTLSLAIPFFHYWPLVYRVHASSLFLAILWIPIYGPKVLGAVIMGFWGKKLANGWGVLTIASAIVCTSCGLIIAGFSTTLTMLLAGTMLLEFAMGYFQPLVSAFVQDRVGEKYRATYGSLQALITGSWSTVVMIGVATAMAMRPDNATAIKSLWWQMGLLMLVAAIPLAVYRPRTKNAPDLSGAQPTAE